jgi:hypothetical protein
MLVRFSRAAGVTHHRLVLRLVFTPLQMIKKFDDKLIKNHKAPKIKKLKCNFLIDFSFIFQGDNVILLVSVS